jgi:DNA repair protein RadC
MGHAGIFPGIRIVYFLWDNAMKIKKKRFCRNAYIPVTEQFPAGNLNQPDTGAAMKKMRDVPQKDRPREKIASKGASALTDTELIEAIIGKGTRSRDVREISKEINRLMLERGNAIGYQDLQSIEGIGPSKASQIMSCFELGRRYFGSKDSGARVTRPEDILPLVANLREKRQEHFVCIALNGAGEVLGNRIITVGLLNHSLVHPREVFADAITDRAASVICVHNHPSGSLEPSSQDIAITTQLKEAGSILGIQLIDHIIVTRTGHVSMKERGLI